MTKKILFFSFLFATMVLQAQQYPYDHFFGADFDSSPQSNDQWYLDIIQAQQAWDITSGVPEIPIAYICASGVNWLHEDLGDNGDGFDNIHRTGTQGVLEQWTDWDDPIDNLFDDDGNSYIDDWRGIINLGSPQGITNNTLIHNPGVIHSTWLTGIMSAKNIGNSGMYGISGGSQNAMGNSLIISGYNYSNHTWEDIPSAIYYALDNGARVILLDAMVSHTISGWGVIGPALEAAFEAGCFVVAPSGWDASNTLWFPSSYGALINWEQYSVFSVGASTEPDNDGNEYRHSLSSYGMGFNLPPGQPTNTELDLVAPGEHLYTTSDVTDEYRYIKGSGPAAAMVAATAGLMLSVNPDLQ
ncbi:MAG: S8 family serine peptidase [Bacteroidales bacterium]|nr:S8 family serine peptidase [Bacteroidales bacterium]